MVLFFLSVFSFFPSPPKISSYPPSVLTVRLLCLHLLPQGKNLGTSPRCLGTGPTTLVVDDYRGSTQGVIRDGSRRPSTQWTLIRGKHPTPSDTGYLPTTDL